MWTQLTDCAKQITPHCKLREKNTGDINIYEIVMVESDQYKLNQLSKNGVEPEEEVGLVLSCEQLLSFNFEIETE